MKYNIAFGSSPFEIYYDTPSISPHSFTKYSTSSSVHLFVNYAIFTLSDANYSSRSYKSKLGGGKSFSVGGNTAAYKPGMGVSNWGGMRVSGSCLTPSV